MDQPNHSDIFSELFDLLPNEKFAKPQIGEEIAPNIDLDEALKKTLAEPEFYTPLNESVFPGDSVAIVLQSDLPHAKLIIESLLSQLSDLNVAASDILVVVSPRTADQLGIESSRYEIPDDTKIEGKRPPVIPVDFEFNSIDFQVHDFENSAGLSYLVASQEGDPVYVNRNLVDADVVIPVGCPKPGEPNQQRDCVYPDFSNSETHHRFAEGSGSFLARWQEIELANDTLGAFFAIQIVCGPGETIRQVCSGARKDAIATARAATNQLWKFEWTEPVDIVVATMESDPTEQSWDGFASSLIAASQLSKSDAPIVIWSELKMNPDRNVRKACMSQFEDSISTKLSKTLQRVAAIVKDHPVFLRSHLKRSVVEELGLGYVETPDQILRIGDSATKGLLVRDAHKCQVGPSESLAVVEETK